ncbi:MAG TPA: hypothetical protein DEP72_02705 [Clostridiales bacterium]|nr:MAG: hypothetical protein A2Y18_08200 [Clostridiales bacterium GWD2_32_19]HCC07065.1 hypothetical protein [Clostridiales bacterium]
MDNMSSNTKLEIAVEIIAAKIAMYSMNGYKSEDEDIKKLIEERNEMYKGNEIIIDKIIRDYGKKNKKEL